MCYLVQLEDLHNASKGKNGGEGENRFGDEDVVVVPHFVSARAHSGLKLYEIDAVNS